MSAGTSSRIVVGTLDRPFGEWEQEPEVQKGHFFARPGFGFRHRQKWDCLTNHQQQQMNLVEIRRQ